MNLPNKITFLRIILIPVILIFLLVQFDFGRFHFAGSDITVSEIIAVILFLIAASTDGLDGYVARRRKLVTNLGKLLDPLADKLLMTAALISLVEMQRLGAAVAIIIIAREFAVTGLRLIAAEKGHVIAASKLGKWKTITQIIALTALMLNNFPFIFISFPFAEISLWVAVVLTTWSGIDYFIKNRRILAGS